MSNLLLILLVRGLILNWCETRFSERIDEVRNKIFFGGFFSGFFFFIFDDDFVVGDFGDLGKADN